MNANMSTGEAAAYCGLATMTLHNYRHHNTGPVAHKVGGRVYYSTKALDEWNAVRLAKKAARAARAAARRAPKKMAA